MKFLLALLCSIVALLPLRAEEKNRCEGAHLQFEQTEYDFGEISRKGDNRSCAFRFVNDGAEPLVIPALALKRSFRASLLLLASRVRYD